MHQNMSQPQPQSIASERARWVVFLTICLMGVGLVWIESASYPWASRPGSGIDAFRQVRRQAIAAVLAVVVLLGAARFPRRRLPSAAWVGFAVSLLWMAAAACFAHSHHGTKAWLGIQPSEFGKVLLLVVGADLLAARPVRSLFQNNVLWFIGLLAVVSGLLCWQRDFGMLILTALSALALLFVAGLPLLELFALTAFGAAATAYMLTSAADRLERIAAWLRPMDHLQGPGYHVMSSLIAIARGGGMGLLPAGSPDKWYGLPHPSADSIFCVIAAEAGIWGTALLFLAFGSLLVLALMAANAAPSEYDRLVALGCGLLLGIQAAVHVGVAVNFLPATGLTLPFISSGGSSLVASAMAAGLIANVARRGRTAAKHEYV